MRKVVGISANAIIEQGGMPAGCRLSSAAYDFTDAVIAAGGVPLILPMTADEEIIKEQLGRIDALIMTGGQDINPLLYGQEPHKLLGEVCDERDETDYRLIALAIEEGMPLLGICRGMQMLNVLCGGTLYQDNSLAPLCSVKHVQGRSSRRCSHSVSLAPGSYLEEIFGPSALVNSFHHMSIAKVAPGFSVTARASDQIVEAIESEANSFAMGVQWHPEMLWEDEKMLDIFRLLISKA